MFGFDKMFDFNRDGKLDSLERAVQFQFMDDMLKEDHWLPVTFIVRLRSHSFRSMERSRE